MVILTVWEGLQEIRGIQYDDDDDDNDGGAGGGMLYICLVINLWDIVICSYRLCLA